MNEIELETDMKTQILKEREIHQISDQEAVKE